MASGKVLRQLIKSGVQGDARGFRAASEAVIGEEREKNHHLLANDLERLLYGDLATVGGELSRLRALSELPANKDNGLALLEERAVVREEKDIILSDSAQSALGSTPIPRTLPNEQRGVSWQSEEGSVRSSSVKPSS